MSVPRAASDEMFSWDDDDAVLVGQDDIGDFNEDNILPEPPESQAAIREWLDPTPFAAENGEFRKAPPLAPCWDRALALLFRRLLATGTIRTTTACSGSRASPGPASPS